MRGELEPPESWSWAWLHGVWLQLKHLQLLTIPVSFFLAAHSPYGTDDRVKLPNLTDEEVNWQGLEDLYSINESLYECRPDYSPSPDNWVNFQKDVDKMFALRHVLNRFNQTHTFDDSTLPELGSGAGGGGFGEGSGEELVDLAARARLATPAPSNTPPAPPRTARPTLGRTLESAVNDIPERLSDKPAGSPGWPDRVLQGNMWAQLEEVEGEVFSGNGLVELETRHDSLLRSHNSQRGQMEPGRGPGGDLSLRGLSLEEEDDIFQAQGYLPFSPQTLSPPPVPSSTRGSPPTATQTSRPTLRGLPRPAPGPPSDFEGSGSPPTLQSHTVRQARWPSSQ